MWLMLPVAHTTTRGSLAVSAGALEVTVSFKALKKCSFLTSQFFFAPFLVELLNQSLALSVVPSAYITPLSKKADLDLAHVKSYRPI